MNTTDPVPDIGLCAAAFGDQRLETALGSIRASGLSIIDLPTDSTLRLLPGVAALEDPKFPARLTRALERHEITVGCLSNSRDTQLLLGPHGPHTDPVREGSPAVKRAHALRYARATIALAATIGVPQVRLYFGCPDFARWLTWGTAEVSWEDNLGAFAEAAAPLLSECRAAGLQLCVEPHPKQVVFDVASTRRGLELLEEYADVLRVCLDPANIATLGYDPLDSIPGWGPALGAVHVKDLETWSGPDRPTAPGWVAYGPQPPIRFRCLGRGGLPWPSMIDALLEEGYTGVIYIEHEDVLLPRDQSIALAAKRLMELLPAAPAEGRTW